MKNLILVLVALLAVPASAQCVDGQCSFGPSWSRSYRVYDPLAYNWTTRRIVPVFRTDPTYLYWSQTSGRSYVSYGSGGSYGYGSGGSSYTVRQYRTSWGSTGGYSYGSGGR